MAGAGRLLCGLPCYHSDCTGQVDSRTCNEDLGIDKNDIPTQVRSRIVNYSSSSSITGIQGDKKGSFSFLIFPLANTKTSNSLKASSDSSFLIYNNP